MIKFSERLRELRTEKGFSQAQLGEVLGVSQRAISDWEKRNCQPNFETLEKLAKYFEVTADYLLGLQD